MHGKTNRASAVHLFASQFNSRNAQRPTCCALSCETPAGPAARQSIYGPQGSTPGIRITQGAEIWRAVPCGAEFSLQLGAADGVTAIGIEQAGKPEPPRQMVPVLANGDCLFG